MRRSFAGTVCQANDAKGTLPGACLGVASGVPNDASPPPRTFEDAYRNGAFSDLFSLPVHDLEAGLARPPVDDPEGLADALLAQAEARGDHPAQHAAIERLRDPCTRVIVTGQQAGVLLGPLFTLSKAMTALRLAAELDRDDRPVVAVFWVAAQDHDAAEIRETVLLGPQAEYRSVGLPFPEGQPAGRTPWERAWSESLDATLVDLYGDGPQAQEARAIVRAASEASSTIADVFARLLSAVLGARGLIVLDPTQEAMARRFTPLLLHDAADPAVGPSAIREAGETLRARGFEPQLGRASDATNLFLQRQGEPRRLLRFDGGAFHPDGVEQERLTVADLHDVLERDPVAITPAAGLRPITQDAVLPTAAVVVGPGELRYFAQLRGVYTHHGVPMPVVWPRASVTLLEPPAVRVLAKHDLDAATFQSNPEGVLEARLLALHGHAERFDASRRELERVVEHLLDEVDAIDPTLQGTVERGRDVLAMTVRRLETKVAAAAGLRDDVTREQFGRLRSLLLPGGGLQERTVSPFAYFARFGVEPIVRRFESVPTSGAHALPIDP